MWRNKMKVQLLSILIVASACDKGGVIPGTAEPNDSILTSVNIGNMKDDSTLFRHMTAKMYCDSAGESSSIPSLADENLQMKFKLKNAKDGDKCYVQIWTDNKKHEAEVISKYNFNEKKENFSSLFFSAKSAIVSNQIDLTFYKAYGTDGKPADRTELLPNPKDEKDIIVSGKIDQCKGKVKSDGSGCVDETGEKIIKLEDKYKKDIDDLIASLKKDGIDASTMTLETFSEEEAAKNRGISISIKDYQITVSGDSEYKGTGLIDSTLKSDQYGYSVNATIEGKEVTLGFSPEKKDDGSEWIADIRDRTSLLPSTENVFTIKQ